MIKRHREGRQTQRDGLRQTEWTDQETEMEKGGHYREKEGHPKIRTEREREREMG